MAGGEHRPIHTASASTAAASAPLGIRLPLCDVPLHRYLPGDGEGDAASDDAQAAARLGADRQGAAPSAPLRCRRLLPLKAGK